MEPEISIAGPRMLGGWEAEWCGGEGWVLSACLPASDPSLVY